MKRELNDVERELATVKYELTDVKYVLSQYRGRTNKAEAETADWKRRFDALLRRTPESTK